MSTSALSAHALQEALAPLVGGAARPTTEADVVAGVRPPVVVEPAGEEEVSAVLAFADREGLKVLVRGGGTQLGLGYPPTGGNILISTARLNRVVEHTPGDLTVTVEAGLPLAELQAMLARAGQWLALDPALLPAATVGGIVATNASGPRRLRYGGVRDQIIGVRIVRADGTIAKGGGKVVKNVAGYDLPKLFTGSLGTLGVIVAATFRLYPLPPASCTVLLNAADPRPLCELALRIIGSTLVASAIDVAGPVDGGARQIMAVRFEGIREAVRDQADTLMQMAASLRLSGGSSVLEDEQERRLWQTPGPGEGTRTGDRATLAVKASVLPSEVAGWLAALRQMEGNLSTSWRAHAGHGLIHARLSGADDMLVAAVAQLRAVATEGRGSLVVADAPPALAQRLDVWGPVAALDLMRRVKEQFDPRATLNPGRFVGGI